MEVSGAVMRILFVNGTSHGGSLLSTHALAARLAALGHDIGVLQHRPGRAGPLRLHKRLENLHAKTVRGRSAALAPLTEALVRRPGRRPGPAAAAPGVRGWAAPVTANALAAVRRAMAPEVIVVAGVLRPQWRQIHAELRAAGVPSVLYLREDALLDHLGSTPAPDLLLANSAALAEAARGRGHDAVMIPSVVDVSGALVASSRETVLMVNPLPQYGGERAWRLAERLPEMRFALQVSWPVGSSDLDAARRRATSSSNVEVREFSADRRRVYRDARVVLVPYPIGFPSARPRVVLEAQANGIPAVASDLPGLCEAVGPGGLLVDAGADDEEWAAALGRLDDDRRYRELCRAALAHARRPEVDPEAIAARFVAVLTERFGLAVGPG